MISIQTSAGKKNLVLRGIRTASGNVTIESGSILTDDGDLKFWDGTPGSLSVEIIPPYANGGAWTAATVTIVTGQVAASASGGSPPYTYAWEVDSDDGGSPAWTIGSASSSHTVFSVSSVPPGITREAVMKCTVTDSRGATGTATVPAQVTNYWV